MTEATDDTPFHNEYSTTGRFQTYPSTQRHCWIVIAQKELDNYKTRKRKNRRMPKNSDFLKTTWEIFKRTQENSEDNIQAKDPFYYKCL
jgi:hypothetical protein